MWHIGKYLARADGRAGAGVSLPILNRILSGVLTRRNLGCTETVGVSTADRIQ
jgi:hypothetical protein